METSGYVPVNGPEMYYEIHGEVSPGSSPRGFLSGWYVLWQGFARFGQDPAGDRV
ncbi:MAG: hypothetical protein LC739_01240 [Actinobacteria bacterium]|nr:hypothetical protein [Actinomycetota bacterium]